MKKAQKWAFKYLKQVTYLGDTLQSWSQKPKPAIA
jgi:hypothetical protein